MELLAPVFPHSFRDELYPIIEQLQERLGAIQDYAVICERLEAWIADATKRQAVHMHMLLRQEQQQLDQLLRDFRGWWTPEYQQQVLDQFKLMIQSADEGEPPQTAEG